MKLVRFGDKGSEKPGVLEADGQIRDASSITADYAGAALSNAAISALRQADISALPLVEGSPRLGSCIAGTPNLICIGLNYVRHAKESGMDVPKEPVVFNKISSCISGPYDNIIIPKDSEKTDWEVELTMVIGEDCEHVSEADALSKISAYCLMNDVSERAFQAERGGQWVKGKSAPTFAPIGPYLVTSDEVSDPQALDLWTEVNGEKMQNSNTSDMIFSIAHIVSYLSRFTRLQAGDVIATGTPEGVGMGRGVYLKPGDVVRMGIEGLGEQECNVVGYPG